jgi:hypothetical protein
LIFEVINNNTKVKAIIMHDNYINTAIITHIKSKICVTKVYNR